MRQRTVLIVIASVLTLVLGLLIWLYISLVRAPGEFFFGEEPPLPAGIEPVKSIYGFGSNDVFLNPYNVALDEQGRIYVTDSNHHRVVVFDRSGKLIAKIGKEGSGRGELRFPIGVAAAPNGNIYVVDKNQNKIVVYNIKGQVLNEIPEMFPLVAAAVDKKLYVATYAHVVVYDLEGKQLARWGNRGRKPGEFDFPGGIAVDAAGRIYVSDSNNLRVQILDKNGEVVRTIGEPKEGEQASTLFGLPEGIVVDRKGNIYVVDAFRGSIFVFDSKGKKITEVGQIGTRDGEFSFPAGLAYDGTYFYICDTRNNRVQLIKIRLPET